MKLPLFFLLIFAPLFNVIECKPGQNYSISCILEGEIQGNLRYKTFFRALELIEKRELKTLVETGTARHGKNSGEGCSTIIWGEFIKIYGGILYSVDINQQALSNAQKALGDCNQYVRFIHSDSIVFLTSFNKPIDFLYLDSYDFDIYNPEPSQQHHLNEIKAAYPFLSKKSVILIDDCNLPYGGKGKLVIEYLLERGWKIIEEDYQVLLIQQ